MLSARPPSFRLHEPAAVPAALVLAVDLPSPGCTSQKGTTAMATTLTGTRTATSDGSVYKNVTTDGYKLEDFKASNYFGLVDVEKDGVMTGLVIRNGLIRNIDRVLTMPKGLPSVLDGFLVEDLDCYDLERGVARLKVARNGVFRRIAARQRAEGTTAFADAFATSDAPTANIRFEHCQVFGFDMIVAPGDYPNGGGFSDEELSTGMVYLLCLAADGNDGFDLKSKGTVVDRCAARRNRRNFRFWGSGTITDCVSEAATNAHFWFGGGSRLGTYQLVRPRFIDGGTKAAHIKLEDANASAVITVIDPLDGDGNIIPRSALRVQILGPGKVDVQYTGAASFPAVDVTPDAPRASAGPAPIEPAPSVPPVVAPPAPAPPVVVTDPPVMPPAPDAPIPPDVLEPLVRRVVREELAALLKQLTAAGQQ